MTEDRTSQLHPTELADRLRRLLEAGTPDLEALRALGPQELDLLLATSVVVRRSTAPDRERSLRVLAMACHPSAQHVWADQRPAVPLAG